MKTIRESAKILGLPDLKVNSTCVRVPVSIGHALIVDALKMGLHRTVEEYLKVLSG